MSGQQVFRISLAAIFIVLSSACLGLTYRGLRFLANYEVTTAEIIACDKELIPRMERKTDGYGRTRTEPIDPVFFFKIQTDRIDYSITRTEFSIPCFTNGIRFRDPKPLTDWCELKGASIFVLHYDKLQVAIPTKEMLDRSGMYWLLSVYLIENPDLLALGLLPSLVIVGAFAWSGLKLLVESASLHDEGVKRREAENVVAFAMRYFNIRLSLFATLLLASLLMIGLGFSLMKGMLYVESENSILTGFAVLVGFAMTSYGPALALRSVHFIRSSKSDYIIFLRNLVLLAAVFKLCSNTWRFVVKEDFGALPIESIRSLLWEIFAALFS